jgi:hypothetical protein
MIVGGGQMPMIQRAMGPGGVVTSTTIQHNVPFTQQSPSVLSSNAQSIQTQQQSFPPAGTPQFQPGFNNGPRPNQTHVNMQGPGPTSIQQLQSTATFSTASPVGVQQRPQAPQQVGPPAAWTPGQVSTTVVQQGQVNQPIPTSTPSNIPIPNQMQAPPGAGLINTGASFIQGTSQVPLPGSSASVQHSATPVGAVPVSMNMTQSNTNQPGIPLNPPTGIPIGGKNTPSTTPTPPTTPGPSPGTPGFPSQPPKATTPTEAVTGQPGTPATTSSNQRNQLAKWESDEPLGDQATIAMILYANQNYPNLKSEYPIWTDRIKQIAKIWKSLPNEKRQPYVQQARENRTASRMNKQVSNIDLSLICTRQSFSWHLANVYFCFCQYVIIFFLNLKTTTSPKPPMVVPQMQVQQPIPGGQQQGFIGKRFDNISKNEQFVITKCFNIVLLFPQ